MLVSSIKIVVTQMTKALVPEEALGTRVKLVKVKLLDRAGWCHVDGSKEGIDLEIGSVSKRSWIRECCRAGGWKQQLGGVAQAMANGAMKLDVFRLP
jgi:hypothetical protein